MTRLAGLLVSALAAPFAFAQEGPRKEHEQQAAEQFGPDYSPFRRARLPDAGLLWRHAPAHIYVAGDDEPSQRLYHAPPPLGVPIVTNKGDGS